MRNTGIAIFVFGILLDVSAFGQTQAARSTEQPSMQCAKSPDDPCCADEAKAVAACFYAHNDPGPIATGPVGLPPLTAGIPRSDVLDSIQKEGPASYKSMMDQSKAITSPN